MSELSPERGQETRDDRSPVDAERQPGHVPLALRPSLPDLDRHLPMAESVEVEHFFQLAERRHLAESDQRSGDRVGGRQSKCKVLLWPLGGHHLIDRRQEIVGRQIDADEIERAQKRDPGGGQGTVDRDGHVGEPVDAHLRGVDLEGRRLGDEPFDRERHGRPALPVCPRRPGTIWPVPVEREHLHGCDDETLFLSCGFTIKEDCPRVGLAVEADELQAGEGGMCVSGTKNVEREDGLDGRQEGEQMERVWDRLGEWVGGDVREEVEVE